MSFRLPLYCMLLRSMIYCKCIFCMPVVCWEMYISRLLCFLWCRCNVLYSANSIGFWCIMSCALVTCSLWVLMICVAFNVLPVMHFVRGRIWGNWGSLHRCMEKQLVKNRFFFNVQYAIKTGMNLCYLLMFYPTMCSCFKCCFERVEENIVKGQQSPPFSLKGLLMRQDIKNVLIFFLLNDLNVTSSKNTDSTMHVKQNQSPNLRVLCRKTLHSAAPLAVITSSVVEERGPALPWRLQTLFLLRTL